MKRLDDGKVSLVDFMRSIKFRRHVSRRRGEVASHFAGLAPRARPANMQGAEDKLPVRSAN
jgi:hypothetical protein